MPSNNPRMMLTLPQELDDDLALLGKAAGKPKAAVVREFLIEAHDSIRAMTRMLEAIKTDPRGVQAMIDASAGQAVLKLGRTGYDLKASLDALPPAKPKRKRKAA